MRPVIRRRLLQKHRVFLRLLAPYLMFMLLTMVLGTVLYDKTLNLVEQETVKSNQQMLDQVKDMIDRRISEIDTIARQLMSDPKIMGLQQVDKPFEGANTYKVYETQNSLFNYNISNNFILDYYLFFKKGDLALSSQTSYTLPKFYPTVLQYEGLDYDSWTSRLFDHYEVREFYPAHPALYEGKTYSLLTYVRSIGYPGHTEGALVILVDTREIEKLLSRINLQDGQASITDADGQVLLSVGPGQGEAGSGGKMLNTYAKSSSSGWTYSVSQPAGVAMEKVFYIKKITFILVFAFLGAGALLAFFFAYRTSRPLQHLVFLIRERLGDSGRAGDTYGFIHSSVSKLIDSHEELRHEIERQAPFLRESFFDRLLKGDFQSPADIESLLDHQKLQLKGKRYAVGLLYFQRPDNGLNTDLLRELDVNRVLIKEVLRDTLGKQHFFHDISEDKIALLFVDQGEEEAAFRGQIEQWSREAAKRITEQLGYKPAVAVGHLYESLLQVNRSFEEARQAAAYSADPGDGAVRWYGGLPDGRNEFYYPGEVETRLINVTKAGDAGEVRELLRMLYHDNFTERHLSLSMQQLLLFELLGSLVKTETQIRPGRVRDFRSLFQRIQSAEVPSEIFRQIAEGYIRLCGIVDERKRSRNVQLIDDIMELIKREYNVADLNLDWVADRMNMSKVYLSQFFREQTGVNFSDYLEKLRMEHAKSLLSETELTIREIACQVGYHSSNTFCRAFKRSNGMSATAFRETSDIYEREAL
ncbi:hypothetical protein AWM70_00465 [Paenibacillus yonginensis]|uniref:HTH araC/xylS-type domain-containing protein n=1 Tax=Paenibacillus yonginensis TaxID=1462996 RepID=A0A1B1MVR4_9BACL|nr:helix-turn-helix domain-containing protein [Paenibacillus yonginensis]ANS73245.1 hypothetical protein AWM70_00465 [Paenibacillus yonginensis]